MTSRILIHDTFATQPILMPVGLDWLQPAIRIEARRSLTAAHLGADDFAVLPSIDAVRLIATHVILPEVALSSTALGAIAMQSPVRADEIDRTAVRLYHCSSVAEFLARATLQEFYGIAPVAWSDESKMEAEVVITEGADALLEPEAGFREDLVRAWFILTGRAVVTHLLVAPNDSRLENRADVVAALQEVLSIANERRKDLRAVVTDQSGVARERVTATFLAQRYVLTQDDVQSLIWLIRRGASGTGLSPVDTLPVVWPASIEP